VIEMKCPACKVPGRVAKDKVNTRLVCRKCLSVFHLTPTGRAVLGEPPQAAATPGKVPREKQKFELDLSLELPPWLKRVTGVVFAPRVLAVAAGLMLLLGGYKAIAILRGESLQERTGKVARAAVIGDLGTLLELTAEGTGDDMIKWYTAVRPQCDQVRNLLRDPNPSVEVQVNKQDSYGGTAEVVARVNPQEPRAPSGSQAPGLAFSGFAAGKSLELPLTLTSEGMGGWMLDGKRTLEAIAKTQ